MKKFVGLILVLFASLGLAGCASGSGNSGATVTVSDAWVRSSDSSAVAGGMTGVFGNFTNNTGHDILFRGGSTDAAMMVQTHNVVDGVMAEQKNGFVIPAGETLTLEPGGLHIMLMNLSAPIVAGDKISFTFEFDGEKQTFELTAKPSAGGDETYNG